RVRSYSTGKVEVTWKGDLEVLGTSRKAREINITVDDHEKTKILFESIGLEVYAHQEKKRISWELDNTQFDLDTYPNMPTYLEIEGESEEKINFFIQELNLKNHDTWNDGERTLIEGKYNLNWCDMRF
ncbi:CYTH domain-containing protein, partial [Candidatus Nomurabacteria bacterium]|nr:CYTH domain-containing protein [Candidatus Nomurabacteria bacterium]